MTEAEWLGSLNAAQMLMHVEPHTSRRKIGLFHCACCSIVTRGWDEDHAVVTFLSAVEDFLEGSLPSESGATWKRFLRTLTRDMSATVMTLLEESPSRVRSTTHRAAREVVAALLLCAAVFEHDRWWATVTDIDDELLARHHMLTQSGREQVCSENVALLRDIFGNPFRPVTFAPEWHTDTAVSLARTMYDGRDFSAIPILADALQDAGCDDAVVLNHCRSGVVHVRGCWVVDLVLGKE